MTAERRKHNRAPFAGDVLINGSFLAHGIDVSEGGLYVHTGRSIQLGTLVEVEFTMGEAAIKVKAEVMSSHEAVGMGLRFISLGEAQRAAVRDFVSKHCCSANAECKKRVMLVDDSDSSRRMNKGKLVLEGYMVLEATDGMDAINRLAQDRPDLIILDLYMEKMDGYKVLSYIKGSEHLKNIPVVVLSARGNPEEVERAMSFGADGFLVKMMTSPVKLCEYINNFFKNG